MLPSGGIIHEITGTDDERSGPDTSGGDGGRGGKGAAMYLRSEGRIVELPAVQVGRVVNTVGAGDALFSAFVHYYAKGFGPIECLKRAQFFASAKICVSGASKGFITEQKIEELLWN